MKKYAARDIKIYRAKPAQRSQGDGEEYKPTHAVSLESNANRKLSDSFSNPFQQTCSSSSFTEVKVANIKDSKADTRVTLPNILDVAKTLSKLSVLSVPNHLLLSAPLRDIEKKEKFQLKPTEPSRYENKYSSISNKKKEPKFVPYEPYKGCVKPILGDKKTKVKVNNILAIEAKPQSSLQKNEKIDTEQPNNTSYDCKQAAEKRLRVMVSDFESERAAWEMKHNELKLQNEKLEKELLDIHKEQLLLQQQLSTQSQVNNELKKLLVASVGEDVQGRVQCLTEDKARMATMIRKYSEKVDRDFEEKEKMSIQCDVWRSKFLASSLLIDELARWKGTLLQHFEAAKEALKFLLEERDVTHHNLINSYRHLYQVREAFDPLHAESSSAGLTDSCDLVSLSVASSTVAENIRDRLLGSLGRAVGSTDLRFPDETRTPGEKLAIQILEDNFGPSDVMVHYSLTPGRAALSQRFHPDVKYEHITVNCCKHCNGDIKVV